MNAFHCYGGVLGRAIALATLPQVLVDGANGVGQAQRVCGTVDRAQIVMFVVMFAIAVLAISDAGRVLRPGSRLTVRPSRYRLVLIAIVAASYLPGWFQALALRADRPAVQAILAREVVAAREAYAAALRGALSDTPAGACFSPSLDSACTPFGGIYIAAAADLLPRRRCIGGESSAVTVAISECTTSSVRAAVVP